MLFTLEVSIETALVIELIASITVLTNLIQWKDSFALIEVTQFSEEYVIFLNRILVRGVVHWMPKAEHPRPLKMHDLCKKYVRLVHS